MQPLRKFLFFLLPSTTAILALILLIVSDQANTLSGCEVLIACILALLLINLIIYRRHVSKNPWLSESNRYRSMKAVTKYGPMGQLVYFYMHVYPYSDSGPKPPDHITDDGFKDADAML